MVSTLIVVCSRCGGLLLAKDDQKTRTCPYCGSTVLVEKVRKMAVARTSNEASEILRKLKSAAGAKGKDVCHF